MKLTSYALVAAVITGLGASALVAQIKETQPAEFPPVSYKGKQYLSATGNA